MPNIIQIGGINIPVIINEMCEDYKILKTSQSNLQLGFQPNRVKKPPCLIMNKNTLAVTLLSHNKGDYAVFFRSFDFDEAVDLSCRAALMMIGENIRANITLQLVNIKTSDISVTNFIKK